MQNLRTPIGDLNERDMKLEWILTLVLSLYTISGYTRYLLVEIQSDQQLVSLQDTEYPCMPNPLGCPPLLSANIEESRRKPQARAKKTACKIKNRYITTLYYIDKLYISQKFRAYK